MFLDFIFQTPSPAVILSNVAGLSHTVPCEAFKLDLAKFNEIMEMKPISEQGIYDTASGLC